MSSLRRAGVLVRELGVRAVFARAVFVCWPFFCLVLFVKALFSNCDCWGRRAARFEFDLKHVRRVVGRNGERRVTASYGVFLFGI